MHLPLHSTRSRRILGEKLWMDGSSLEPGFPCPSHLLRSGYKLMGHDILASDLTGIIWLPKCLSSSPRVWTVNAGFEICGREGRNYTSKPDFAYTLCCVHVCKVQRGGVYNLNTCGHVIPFNWNAKDTQPTSWYENMIGIASKQMLFCIHRHCAEGWLIYPGNPLRLISHKKKHKFSCALT